MSATVEIKGLKELGQALTTLPDKLQQNMLRSAIRAAGKVIVEDARGRINDRSGRLAASLRTRTTKRSGEVQGSVLAGGNTPKAKGVGNAYYAHMVEGGTQPHVIKAPPGARLKVFGLFYTSVQHPGIKARPFLKPALDAKGGEAVLAFGQYIKARLAKKHGLDLPDPFLGSDGVDL